jgi:DNA-binding NarL/FixJ family response regulator
MEYWANDLTAPVGDKPGLLLVDPHDFTRQCMSDLLGEHAAEWDVWASTSLSAGGSSRQPDLILLRHDGQVASSGDLLEVVEAASSLYPGVPIALLCSLLNLGDAFATMRLGIRGFLSPSLSVEQVIAALRLVMAGGIYVAPCTANGSVVAPVVAEVSTRPPAQATEPSEPIMATAGDGWPLTPREEDVCHHLRQGKPNKVIAYELGMSENTVKVHVSRILRKLNVMNRTALACMDDDTAKRNNGFIITTSKWTHRSPPP